MPARCWMAPEMPMAMYSWGATTLPVCPTCMQITMGLCDVCVTHCYSGGVLNRQSGDFSYWSGSLQMPSAACQALQVKVGASSVHGALLRGILRAQQGD